MDFFVWQRTCVDDAGNVLASASVTVTDVVSGALAQLYADPAGSVSIGNPITADSEGFVQFYVKAGFYNITATSGASSRTWTREAIGAPHPRTAAEISAGVTPVDYRYPEGHVYRYGTNTTPGETDMTDAIQTALNVMAAKGGGDAVVESGSTLLHTDTIFVPPTCRLISYGYGSVLKAGAGFPATISSSKFGGTAGYTFAAPQVWLDYRGGSNTTIFAISNIALDGDSKAPVGLLITGGANIGGGWVRAYHHTSYNVVFDAVQNSVFFNFRAQHAPTLYRVINGTQHVAFIGCNGARASVAHVEFNIDEDFPGSSFGFANNVPARNMWFGGICENDIDITSARLLHVVEGDRNHFLRTSFISVGDVTTAGMEFGANTSNNALEYVTLQGSFSEVPAIIDRGFQNTYHVPYIVNWGQSTLVNLIEVHNRAIFYKPVFSGINVSGKHIANVTDANAQRIVYTPVLEAGAYASRPTEDIDAYYTYFQTSTKSLMAWDPIDDMWISAQDDYWQTAANLGDATHPINTQLKRRGKMVYDVTNNVPLWAAGSAPTDPWVDRINAGAGTITPVEPS